MGAGVAGNPVVGTMSAMQALDQDVQKLVAANPGMPELAAQLAPYIQGIREVVVQLLSSQNNGAPGAAQLPGLPPALPPGSGISEGQQMGTGVA